jgi:hypothetical protein
MLDSEPVVALGAPDERFLAREDTRWRQPDAVERPPGADAPFQRTADTNVDLRSRGETADWAAAEPTGSREADASRIEEHHLPDRRGGQMPAALWQEVQAQTAPLSPKGRLAIVQGSRHSVQNDRPHVVIAAVLEAMCEARADR